MEWFLDSSETLVALGVWAVTLGTVFYLFKRSVRGAVRLELDRTNDGNSFRDRLDAVSKAGEAHNKHEDAVKECLGQLTERIDELFTIMANK